MDGVGVGISFAFSAFALGKARVSEGDKIL